MDEEGGGVVVVEHVGEGRGGVVCRDFTSV